MGKLFLVGAGPGSADLITIKALRLIKEADCIIYDSLIPKEILEEADPKAELIDVGKRMGREYSTQDEINEMIINAANRHDKVVRLKGGDPFVFGRGGEEAIALEGAGIKYETVPGVTSAVSVPEHAGIPVTHRKEARSFTVITGHTAKGYEIDYSGYAGIEGTLVFLMGLNSIPTIRDGLMKGGMDPETPAAVISSGFMPNEKTVRGKLSDIEEKVKAEGLVSPAIIVVGSVTAHDFSGRSGREEISIGVSGTDGFYERMRSRLERLGVNAEVKHCFRSKLVIRDDGREALKKALSDISSYGWILFASQNAIDMFFEIADEEGFDRRYLGGIKMAVVGGATAKWLRKYGYKADLVPEDYTVESLAGVMAEKIKSGSDPSEKVLAIRAVKGNEVLYDVFDKENIRYDKVMLYDTEGEPAAYEEQFEAFDWIVFGSGSGVDLFFEGLEREGLELGNGTRFACIGDPTASALAKYGREADISAGKHTAEELARELAEKITENR